ncbi:uncharacterized protein [Magallana gigas]|uniref:uncharacterized protein isoform X2 n=1 Tax=Magallana gigas TaxID=29159 RepID=UPI003342A3B1
MTQKASGNVDACPVTKETWEARAEAKKADCGGQSVYHCLADSEGRKWERCVEKTRIKEDVYCLGNNSASTYEQENEELRRAKGFDDWEVFAIVFTILCTIAVVFGLIILWKKRSSLNLQDDRGQHMLFKVGRSKGIVKERVFNGTSLLLRSDVKSLVVLGKLGNAVSSTSRRISKKFKKLKNWGTLDCRYTEIPDTVNEKTIMFVNGWFGIWNDDLCSLEKAKTACQSLSRILSETNKVKLIIGMRSDLFMKYHGELIVDDYKTHLFLHEINLDSANNDEDAEYAKYFYKNISNKCQSSPCAFRRLTCDMIQTGKDNAVGMPLKLKLIQKYHDLMHNYEGEWDISTAMRYHFNSLENDERKRHVYAWIVYICLKGHFTRDEPFDTELVKKLGFQIDKSSFNEKEMQGYFMVRNSNAMTNASPSNAQYHFWHQFIYICAFKLLFEKDPGLVMKYCNVDAILQLVRPEGVKTSYFEVTADEHYVNLFNERIRELNLAERYEKNPLVKSRTCDTKRASQELQ